MANPFNVFKENINKVTPSPLSDQRFTCGFQFSYSAPSETNIGATASGLHAIFNAFALPQLITGLNADINDPYVGQIAKPIINKDFYYVHVNNGRKCWIIRDLDTLISNLNILDSNIAAWLSTIDVSNNTFIQTAISNQRLSTSSSSLLQSIFNQYTTVNFPGSYTNWNTVRAGGAQASRGNGITKLFVLSDQDVTKWQVSRAGLELKVLVDYLAYGGNAVIGPDWLSLNQYTSSVALPTQIRQKIAESASSDPEQQDLITTTGYFTGNLYAVVCLDQGGAIEARGATYFDYGITGSNRIAYGSQYFSYLNSGVSASLAYGLSGGELTNSYCPATLRRSFLTTFFKNVNTSTIYDDIPIIHAGLSGTDISLLQDTETGNYTDIFRYPGLNGLTGIRRENNAANSGFTSYILNESDYSGLNRLFCVCGKNIATYTTTDFGDPLNGTLIVSIPPLGDVAGLMALAKNNTSQGIFAPPIGTINGLVLNGTVMPNIGFQDSPQSRHFYNNRVNFFDTDQFSTSTSTTSYFLASELVGATASSVSVADRNSVMWMVRNLRSKLNSIVGALITNRISNSELWNDVTVAVLNEINTNYSRYLNSWAVTCDGTNNEVNAPNLTVDVEVTPKRSTYSYTVGFSVDTFKINITVAEPTK